MLITADKIHGIPGWIKQIPQTYSQVYIEYDNDDDDGDLRTLLDAIAGDEKKEGRNVRIVRNQQNLASVAITRAGKIIHAGSFVEDNLEEDALRMYGSDVETVIRRNKNVTVHLFDLVENISHPIPPIQICDEYGLLTLGKILIQRPELASSFDASKTGGLAIEDEPENQQNPRPW